MGIRGLTTFISSYADKYTETKYFHDIPIVIDGNNLMNYLLRHPSSPNYHLIVGNYPFYAQNVRRFFQDLKSCKIVPIVIFDGAYEIEKMITVEKRHREILIKNVHHNVPGNTYLPKCTPLVFNEILTEQNIIQCQTQYEADDTIAYIGKKLDCPILSSDSDFHIYPDLKYIIPLESIEFRKVQLKGNTNGTVPTNTKRLVLVAKFVSMKKLCTEEFKFDDLRLLPLVAVILGNDRIPPSIFANFHKCQSDSKYDRFKFLFKRIGKQGEYDDIYTKMIQSVKLDKRLSVQNQVDAILHGYSGENGEKLVWNYVKSKVKTELPIEEIEDEEVSNLPKWFSEEHLKAKIPASFLKIWANKILFIPPQVEIQSFSSSHDISVPILGVVCGLIIGSDEMILVSREKKQAVKNRLIIPAKLLEQLPNIRNPKFRNKAQSVFLDAFQLTESQQNFVQQWPPGIKLVMICLIYFSGKVGLNKSSFSGSIIAAVILSFLKPFIKTNNNKEINNTNEDSSTKTITEYLKSQSMTKTLLEFFEKYDKIPYFGKTAKKTYDIRYSYAYSQFQNVLYNSILLCKLLGNPFKIPKVSLLNSCLVYNICDKVHEDYANEINTFFKVTFKNDVSIIQLINLIYSNITSNPNPTANFIQERADKELAFSDDEKSTTGSESDISPNDIDDNDTVAYVNYLGTVTNRFSALSVNENE